MPTPTPVDDLVARARRHIRRAEEHAGSIPAKEAVKLVPMDWHAVCQSTREAADRLEAQAAEIARLREAIRSFKLAHTEMQRAEDRGTQPRLMKAGNRFFKARTRLFRLPPEEPHP